MRSKYAWIDQFTIVKKIATSTFTHNSLHSENTKSNKNLNTIESSWMLKSDKIKYVTLDSNRNISVNI
jgi:hypothetical protein